MMIKKEKKKRGKEKRESKRR